VELCPGFDGRPSCVKPAFQFCRVRDFEFEPLEFFWTHVRIYASCEGRIPCGKGLGTTPVSISLVTTIFPQFFLFLLRPLFDRADAYLLAVVFRRPFHLCFPQGILFSPCMLIRGTRFPPPADKLFDIGRYHASKALPGLLRTFFLRTIARGC